MYEEVVYEVAEPIATLTLNRPKRLNAWTARMGQEIKHAFAAAEKDSRVLVVIVTGQGRGFCSGADLRALDALSQGRSYSGEESAPLDADPGDASMGPSFRGTFSYPMSILKPIIGAINGPCVGLGLPIVHQIVADHGGTIRVEDNTPHGSRFVVELPAGRPVAAPVQA